MEFSVITLPVMHLVCNVMMSPNSSVPEYSNFAPNQTAPAITLTSMRLACHIVVSPNSTVPENINLAVNRSSDQSVNQSTDQSVTQSSDQFQFSTLPSGYIVYPDINAAYKVFDEQVTWDEARTRCALDDAKLAEIDSEVKIQLVQKQRAHTTNYVHVGFNRRVAGSSTFYSEKTGLAVASLPWGAGEPAGDSLRCVMLSKYSNRLGVYSCINHAADYVCERPIPEHLKRSK